MSVVVSSSYLKLSDFSLRIKAKTLSSICNAESIMPCDTANLGIISQMTTLLQGLVQIK